MAEIIGSKENKIAKQIKSLYTKEGREKEGIFIIEGYRNVRDAAEKGAVIERIILREDVEYRGDLGAREVTRVTKKLYGYLSDTVTPQGIMAVCKMPQTSFSDISVKENSLILVCENLRDPGNAGTIIRAADAAGAAGVIMTKGSVDIYNPKTARALMSSLFSVKVVRNKSLDAVFGFLKDKMIKSVAGALRDDAENLFSANLKGRCAVFVGNEANGLTDEAIRRCDKAVKIPILGGAESLNASVAAAVMMYEHVRQNTEF